MPELTLFELARQVQQLRQVQNQYFDRKRFAAQEGTPLARRNAANALMLSKRLEKELDEVVERVILAGEEAPASC